MDGIRTQKTEDGTETNYLVDSNRDYAQVIAETDSANTVAVEYIFGDDLLSQKRNAILSNYHYDGLGSTRTLTDSTGAVTDSYYYDAFGVTLATEGSTENDYLFTGEQYDAGLGNYYLRARYYDSSVGRFTQQDTWMGRSYDPKSLHKYLYTHSAPVNFIDPTGYFSLSSIGAAINVRGILTTTARATYSVARSAGSAGVRSVSFVANYMGRMAVNVLRPLFRAVGRLPLRQARGRKINSVDKFKRFFVSPNKTHPRVDWGPMGKFLKKAFPNTRWEQHHVGIQAKWFRQGSPSQWYPRDALANRGLQRLGNAGFNLMAIPRGLNGALGRSGLGTAGLAIGSYGIVAYAVHEIFESFESD